jgi:FlaA1/EpsC-like NDP-sugar epimerase
VIPNALTDGFSNWQGIIVLRSGVSAAQVAVGKNNRGDCVKRELSRKRWTIGKQPMKSSSDGKVVLITGGTSGIGSCITCGWR